MSRQRRRSAFDGNDDSRRGKIIGAFSVFLLPRAGPYLLFQDIGAQYACRARPFLNGLEENTGARLRRNRRNVGENERHGAAETLGKFAPETIHCRDSGSIKIAKSDSPRFPVRECSPDDHSPKSLKFKSVIRRSASPRISL